MLVVIIIITLISTFVAGLGWGGNGKQKEYLGLFGGIGILAGLVLTFLNLGIWASLVYLLVAPSLATGFTQYFQSKIGL